MTDRGAKGPAQKGRTVVSLNLRMLAVLLLAAGLAWGLNRGVLWVGYRLIDQVYMSPQRQFRRQQQLVAGLTDYVQANAVASNDADALSTWCREVQHIYLSIYEDGSEVLGTDGNYIVQTYIETYTDNEVLNNAQREAARQAENSLLAQEEWQPAYGDAAGAGEDEAGAFPAAELTPAGSAPHAEDGDAAAPGGDAAAEDAAAAQSSASPAGGPAAQTPPQDAAAGPQEGETELFVYDDDAWMSGEELEELEETQLSVELYNILYQVPFANGPSMVSLVEYSELRYYNLVDTASLAAAVTVLLGALLAYTSSLTRRVTTMSRMVARVADGDLEAPIVPHGRDELYLLATDVEAMRTAIVQRLHSEQQAWQANSQLITAISHDIRNPLTSLIGYTDLLAGGQVTDATLQQQYIDTCRDKAYQLKELTDQLFGYFVVFGSPTLRVTAEQLDLRLLLEQLLGEAVFQLQAQGLQVAYTPLPEDCAATAAADVMLLKRMFDNLFSNIAKYADRALPVTVTASCLPPDAPTGVQIVLGNGVSKTGRRTESNCIGLRTCAKIAQELGIDFAYGLQDAGKTRYAVRLHIPAAVVCSGAPPAAPNAAPDEV